MNTRSVVMVFCFAAACADNLEVPETNVTPVAVARVLGDDRIMPSFAFSGAALELTLDASKSHDLDGSVAKYRWLSATQLQDLAAASGGDTVDAGPSDPGRWVPEGEPAEWPDDVQQPSVRLPGPGNYAFVVWVTDDGGRVSDPNTLTIEVTAP